ncbi:hypothetical protein LCGC14_0140870 [marine sediment metagenome]|uniref:Nudix hydrolase domain-containing protein n=1 Tax=marine sediment metagenome TaxID=412755 RepID=A0A0F9XI55_9ZZZZ
MIEMAWIILRNSDRFLLVQQTSDRTWTFPGKLRKDVGVCGNRLRQLCNLQTSQYRTIVSICDQWQGELRPNHYTTMGVGWFTLVEIHSLGQSLTPFVSDSLMYLTYLIQHYDNHPSEWLDKWENSDASV